MIDPSLDPFVGQQVANFRIDELVKDGTLSRVYRGRDVIARRPVAVKIIDARQEQDKQYLERFLREARGMMSAWWHQHITRIYYAAKRDGRYITVMEYVDGPNLQEVQAQYAKDGELIPVDDVIRIGRAVAEALAYAHQHGVLHRDVKPSNVLMCIDGRILLTDFGLAPPILNEDIVQTYGTPDYISPEQIAAPDEVDSKADLYSLAAMLYELLVGKPLFQSNLDEGILQQQLSTNPPVPSVVNPQLNREVDAVLLKGLAKSPEIRYQTVGELVAALEQALGASIELLTEEGEMPPLPAVTQVGADSIPTVSQVSVVDKMASQLEMSDVGELRPQAWLTRRRVSMLGCWAAFLLLIGALGIIGFYGWSFFVSGRPESATSVPVAAVTAIESMETAVPVTPVISATVIVMVTMALPTATNTLLPSETPSPTSTATPTPIPPTTTPPPTVTPPFNGPPIRFLYDQYSFYILNPAVDALRVSNVGFQAVAANEQPTGQDFRGRDWSTIYPDLESGRCDAIELMNAPNWLRPLECAAYNVTLTPPITYDAFWVDDGNIVAFRVFWNGRNIGTCPVVTGVCQLQLP